MKSHRNITVVAVCCLAFLALQCSQQQPASDTKPGFESALRSINTSWFKAYNAGDVESIVALYADDGVVSAPGVPPARGHAAIRELLIKDVAGSKEAGVSLVADPTTDAGISGDLGWEWGSFKVTDQSGATVDRGKYVSVFARKNGKWLIIRDIWNSDGPMEMTEMK